MRILFLCLACSFVFTSCAQNSNNAAVNSTQSKNDVAVGGACEGCEAVFETPVPFEYLNNTDTMPGFNEGGPKLKISGIIYQRDGKTPASNVVLYVYQTDQQGNYSTKPGAKGWGLRHGYQRGWIRTGDDGTYAFYTVVPASYPNSSNPKHIHPVIKETGKTAYWIDEFVFDDDPLLPATERKRDRPVGGSGLLKPVMKDGMLHATRNIILGMNVRQYQ